MHLAHVDAPQAVVASQQALHRQGHRRVPFLARAQLGQRARCVASLRKRAPASLADSSISTTVKWLGEGAVSPLAIDGKMDNATLVKAVRQWCSTKGKGVVTPIVIVSYEKLRLLTDEIGTTEIGLLLADEGHRLKNSGASQRSRTRRLTR